MLLLLGFFYFREHKVQTLIMITVNILLTQDKGLTTLSEMLVSHALTTELTMASSSPWADT